MTCYLNDQKEISIITSTINTHVYMEILDNFLIPSTENLFGNDEVIFRDNNASCHRIKEIQAFLLERQNKISGMVNSPDINPIENQCSKFEKKGQWE